MRVGLKLTFVILGLLVMVLGIEGVLRLRSEREVFESDMEHEQRLLGRALVPSLKLAWRSEGLEAAETILAQAQKGESEVRIRLVALEEGAAGQSLEPVQAPHPRRHHLTLEPLVNPGTDTTFVDRTQRPGVVYTYIPILGPNQKVSAIELSKSLAQTEQRLKRSMVRVFLTALVIALGAGFLAVTVGDHLMGHPLRRLAGRAARIAAGDLSPPAPSTRHDEIGQLNRAIVRMVEGLARAREQVAQETEARLEAERRARQGERLAAVGTLAAGVAHELGTPLQVVSGRARMIEKDASAKESSVRNAELIREQARRMERIVRSLLSLAHPTRIAGDALDLAQLIQETVSLHEPETLKQGVSIHVESLPPVRVNGDRDHLGQILSNLLRNAAQAMPSGGQITVSLQGPSQRVPPTGEKPCDEGYTCITVTDEGPGVSKEIESKVFDPFFTTKDVGKGTGLGLSLAYRMAREHGGWIEVESGREHGAAFSVWLPALKESA